jgi:23S rRNA pseudouridine2604 synthase
VEGELNNKGMDLLRNGLSLDSYKLKPAIVHWQNDNQLCFVLTEGRNRQIRRMCELVGLHVIGLKRVRIGNVLLGDLPAGMWRFLDQKEKF